MHNNVYHLTTQFNRDQDGKAALSEEVDEVKQKITN